MRQIQKALKAQKVPENRVEKVLTREEILQEAKALETRPVKVAGWSGKVMMRNISFQRLVELKISAPDASAYPAMLVAEVCTDLSLEDAIQLQNGNGFKFATLYAAVESYGTSASDALFDEKIKN